MRALITIWVAGIVSNILLCKSSEQLVKCWYLNGECKENEECCDHLKCIQNICRDADLDGPSKENLKTSTWLKQMGLQKNRPGSEDPKLKIALIEITERKDNVDERGIYLEGDMRLPPQGRAGRTSSYYRWKNNIMAYETIDFITSNCLDIFSCFQDAFRRVEKERMISSAIKDIESKTCFKFKSRTTEVDYVKIMLGKEGSGCWSWVGRLGGAQELNLAPDCFDVGTIVHELMHALGFHHEHNRPDRGDHITINWTNILPKEKHNFNEVDPTVFSTMGFPYDYESIMHYSSFAFAIRRNIPTIRPKLSKQIGQRKGLSDLDVAKIKKMYGCPQQKS